MMCQGEIFMRWHNFWCLWNTLLLLFFSDHFEFSDDRYGITFFGKIQSVRRTSVRNYEHRIIKWLVIIKQMGILFKVCDSIYIYIYICVRIILAIIQFWTNTYYSYHEIVSILSQGYPPFHWTCTCVRTQHDFSNHWD